MPFPPPKNYYQKLRALAKLASEKYQELVNVYFRRHPDSDDASRTYPIKSLAFTQYGTNSSTPGSKACLGLGSFQPSTGTYGYLYAAFDNSTPDTRIFTYRSSAADPTDEGATANFATNGNDVEFTQAADTLYCTNGVDAVVKRVAAGTWSALASGEPLSGAGTVAKYLCWHNFMLFAGRTVNAPNKLNVSDAGTPETYSGNTKTFPNAIVSLKSLGEYLVVYTEKTIHTVSGLVPSALSFRDIPNAHPCVSHRSVVTVVQQDARYSATGTQSGILEHWYLSHDYVWAFNGSTFRILGQDSWENYRSNLSSSYLHKAAAVFDVETGQYWLSVTTGSNTTNNVTWAYDPQSDTWSEKPFFKASVWARHGSPVPETYFGDAGAFGRVYQANTGNDIPFPTTQIRGDHTAATVSILADSTTNFPLTGTIMLGDESIYYGDIDQPGLPTAPSGADSGVAGNPNGTYTYKVTFVTSTGETTPSSASGNVVVVNKKIDVSSIALGGEGTTSRKLYRTEAGPGATWKLVTTISDNSTTTYTDNVADGSLGAAAPSSDTANAFLICTRGYSGTTAAAHLDNTDVYPAHVFKYTTRNMDFGEPDLFKKYQVLWVNAKVSGTQMGLYLKGNIDQSGFTTIGTIDLQSSGTTWGSFTWGASDWGAPSIIMTPDNRVAVSGRGKTIKIAAEEYASIQQTEVYEMDLKLRPLKIK